MCPRFFSGVSIQKMNKPWKFPHSLFSDTWKLSLCSTILPIPKFNPRNWKVCVSSSVLNCACRVFSRIVYVFDVRAWFAVGWFSLLCNEFSVEPFFVLWSKTSARERDACYTYVFLLHETKNPVFKFNLPPKNESTVRICEQIVEVRNKTWRVSYPIEV